MHRYHLCCPPQPFGFRKACRSTSTSGVLHHGAWNRSLGALGGELRWAFMPGSALMPAVAARLMSQTNRQLKLQSTRAPDSTVGFERIHLAPGLAMFNHRVSAPNLPPSVRKRGTDQVFCWRQRQSGFDELAVEGDRTGKANFHNNWASAAATSKLTAKPATCGLFHHENKTPPHSGCCDQICGEP